MPLVDEQEAVRSSSSESLFSDSDELVQLKIMEKPSRLLQLPHESKPSFTSSSAVETSSEPETHEEHNSDGRVKGAKASKPKVTFSVEPNDGEVGSDQSNRDTMEGSNNDVLSNDAVMSLHDLDQYDIMLQGLIDELSTISDNLVSKLHLSVCKL